MNFRKEKLNKKLHVAVVLDESGSMGTFKKEIITGLNEHIQELKKNEEKIDTTFTIVKFSSAENINVIKNLVPVKEINDFSDKEYNPKGLTAMYDGVGKAISILSNDVHDDELTTYLLLIVSDGAENNSYEFNAKQIADLIKEKKETKRWTITYLGSNQDLTVVSENLGIDQSNMMTFNNTNNGFRSAFNRMTYSTSNYIGSLASITENNTSTNTDRLLTNFYSAGNSITDAEDQN